jgi:hypothetical protein
MSVGYSTGLEDCYQRLEEHRGAVCHDHEMDLKTQASPAFQRANTVGRNSTAP